MNLINHQILLLKINNFVVTLTYFLCLEINFNKLLLNKFFFIDINNKWINTNHKEVFKINLINIKLKLIALINNHN